MTECPHCRKHYDEPVKIPPRNTLAQIIVIFLITVFAGSIFGIGVASMVISVYQGKPGLHYPGASIPEIIDNHRIKP